MQPVREVQTPNRRLDSWKEIAAFFDRDERTVKRWEKERSLPVHRLPGSSRARVFAFTDELSQWMRAPDSLADRPVASPQTAAGSNGDLVERPSDESALASPPLATSRTRRYKLWIALAMCAALAVLAGIALLVASHRQGALKLQPSTAGSNSAGAVSGRETAATEHADPAARELYLKGRYYWNKRTPADLTKAVDFFNQAIAKDPDYAQAYVGLADCYNLLREYAAMPPQEAYPLALAAARKAIALDDSSAPAHTSLAFVTFYWNWDVAGADREFRRALELDPNYVVAHHWYATFLMTLGRFQEALAEIDRAQQLDPSSTAILSDKALIISFLGREDEAIALLEQLQATEPSHPSSYRYLSSIYLGSGNYPKYIEQARKFAILTHDEPELAVAQAAEKGFRSGGGKGMLGNVLRVRKKLFAAGQMQAYSVATASAYLNNNSEALHYLQISDQRHEASFTSIRVDIAFAALHDDPAFRKLVVQAGLPPVP